MKTSANVVGRRLRRFLGALLAASFGVTWWSLVPPVAAAVVRSTAIELAPEPIELRWSQTTHEPPPPPKPRVIVHRVVVPAVPPPELLPVDIAPLDIPIGVVPDPTPDPIVVPPPQLDPDDYLPIRTRSSR